MEFKSAIEYFGEIDPSVATSIPVPGYLTPPQIATAYQMPASNGAGTKVGIISLGGGYLSSDINKAMTDLGLPVPTINQVLLDGATGTFSGNLQTFAGMASMENTLDLYCIASLVPSANIVIYIGQPNTLSFQNLIDRAVIDNCDVISISWLRDELPSGDSGQLEGALANAVSKSINVFCASGDYGSESASVNDGRPSAGYPASSPNVVGVGGTVLSLTTNNTRLRETASTTSGGGISTIFSLPVWQSRLTWQGYYQPLGIVAPILPLYNRGVPDISAPMNNYAFWFNNNIVYIGGTSASAPVMASMLARCIALNGGRRPPSRSLNPIFYANRTSFLDMIGGSNASNPTGLGYVVTPGWDPVTGLGSQANAIQTYQSVTSSGAKVKNSQGVWSQVQAVKVKTDSSTWTNTRAIWTKVNSTTWKQVY